MLTDLAWVVLHAGHGSEGAVAFETVLGTLIAVLVVAGVLWYSGTFEPSDPADDGESVD